MLLGEFRRSAVNLTGILATIMSFSVPPVSQSMCVLPSVATTLRSSQDSEVKGRPWAMALQRRHARRPDPPATACPMTTPP
jgi:hypothetical protein